VADHRHKRETEARRKPKALAVIGPLAVLATASAVTIGVVAIEPASSDLTPLGAASASMAGATSASDSGSTSASAPASASASAERSDAPLSRSDERVKASGFDDALPPAFMSKASITAAIKAAKKQLWTTDALNIWSQPGDRAKLLGELEAGKKVLVTGREMWGRTEIVLDRKARWVTDGYLADEKPPTLGGDCTNGTTVESGVSDHIVAVHNAVCANFPDITVYGTLRGGGGDHPLGRAVDIMVSGEEGWAVANFVRENASALGVSYVIFSQHIWSVQRSGEGWRGMASRGSTTANHYDHVHVSVY
jgi:hypothetical protein